MRFIEVNEPGKPDFCRYIDLTGFLVRCSNQPQSSGSTDSALYFWTAKRAEGEYRGQRHSCQQRQPPNKKRSTSVLRFLGGGLSLTLYETSAGPGPRAAFPV